MIETSTPCFTDKLTPQETKTRPPLPSHLTPDAAKVIEQLYSEAQNSSTIGPLPSPTNPCKRSSRSLSDKPFPPPPLKRRRQDVPPPAHPNIFQTALPSRRSNITLHFPTTLLTSSSVMSRKQLHLVIKEVAPNGPHLVQRHSKNSDGPAVVLMVALDNITRSPNPQQKLKALGENTNFWNWYVAANRVNCEGLSVCLQNLGLNSNIYTHRWDPSDATALDAIVNHIEQHIVTTNQPVILPITSTKIRATYLIVDGFENCFVSVRDPVSGQAYTMQRCTFARLLNPNYQQSIYVQVPLAIPTAGPTENTLSAPSENSSDVCSESNENLVNLREGFPRGNPLALTNYYANLE